MKELYISPEANIIAFAPMERLANSELDEMVFGNMFSLTRSTGIGGVSDSNSDIGVGGDATTPDINE